jgi:hypothetical protein
MSKAQEFYNQYAEISEDIDRLNSLQEQIEIGLTRNSVKRNGDIHLLRYKGEGYASETICTAIDGLVSESARSDYSLLKHVESVGLGISQLSAAIEHQKEEFAALWNDHAREFSKVSEDLTAQRNRAAGLEARLREHSLSNPAVRDHVWNVTGGKCFYCQVELTRERCAEEPHRCFHVDHLVAKSNGGPDHKSNYVPACHRCNVSKGAKPYVEFVLALEAKCADPDLKVVGGTDA